MKKIYSVLALLVLLLVTGCSGDNPSKTAEKAVNALLQGDMKTYYELLCDEDRSAMTEVNFIRNYNLPEDIRQIISILPEATGTFKASKFKETISGDNAVVTYLVNVPDADKIGKEVLTLNDLMALTNGGKLRTLNDLPKEVLDKIVDYVHKNGVPTKELTGKMSLVKENELWKVKLDLANNYPNGVVPEALRFE